MQLDRIAVQPRQRNAWSAIDLGWLIARTWWWPLFISWMAPSFLLFIVLCIVLPEKWWQLNAALIWWLKPLWDNAPLYIASRALFNERPTPLAAWKKIPGLLRWELLPWLTWRRFNPARATDMPVTLLEQLRGGERTRRLALLHRNIGSAANWLTIVCAHFEAVITFGIFGLALWLLPDELHVNPFNALKQRNPLLEFALASLTYWAMALVAPFYTAAGFALYISRRIELEGWDIEIRFRHLAARIKANHSLAALLLMIVCVGAMPLPAQAQIPIQTQTQIQTQSDDKVAAAKQQIEKILAGADFHRETKIWSWRLKDKKEEPEQQKPIPDWLIRALEWLEQHSGWLATHRDFFNNTALLIRFALGVVLVSVLIYLLYRYRDVTRQWLRLRRSQSPQATRPEILFGLDVRTESLPDDVPSTVLALWHNNETRAALSLLYRATLAQLLTRFALPFHSDHTEQECAAIVAASKRHIAPFFDELTRMWQQLAYGHRSPATTQMENLCANWQRIFGDEN